jgi:elongation factor 1-beta
MGKVALTLRVFPEDMGFFQEIKEEIWKELAPAKISEEELAFGMKALKVLVILDDKSGGSEAVEEKIRGIRGVSEVQVESVDLI